MISEVTLILDSGRLAREAVAGLTQRFEIRRDGQSRSRRTYFDTFDWRVYREGGTLSAEPCGECWTLWWRRLDGGMRHRLNTTRIPEFARDLEAGAFRKELAGITDIRRLLPLARVESDGESLAILDRRRKTVVRVHHERGTASPGGTNSTRPMVERLRIVPVLGYERDHAAVVSFLEEDLSLTRHDNGELALALATLGSPPCSYTSKLELRLDPAMRADEAMRKILLVLLETMRANVDGTRRDLDPEFLHDFRVAGRRTRSCLGQLKGVLDPDATGRFRGEFSWLGAVTGRTRDLDVYLLTMDAYRLEVPESLRGGLDALEEYLRKAQRSEQLRVARALASPRYRELVRDWSLFLERSAGEQSGADCPDAARTIELVAGERVHKAFERVRKRGRNLSRHTPAQTVHRLRIDCKKLRYLFEFFRSLFEAERVSPFIRSLKELQDHLGDFNDLTVQQADLRKTAAEMLEGNSVAADTLLAMGCLVGRLERRQRKLKRRVVDSVGSFVNEASCARLRELVR